MTRHNSYKFLVVFEIAYINFSADIVVSWPGCVSCQPLSCSLIVILTGFLSQLYFLAILYMLGIFYCFSWLSTHYFIFVPSFYLLLMTGYII